MYLIRSRIPTKIGGANIRRSREQCKQTCLICIAEAQQYMWTRSGQIYTEAESIAEAQQDMWRSQISKKPRAFPRRNRICGEAKYRRSREHCRGATGYVAKPNIAEAESLPEAQQYMWTRSGQIYTEAESIAEALPDMWRSQISQNHGTDT